MTDTALLYFVFFSMVCIPNLSNSKNTSMMSFLYKRQSPNGLGEIKDQSDPCWNFTIGNLRDMKFYSPKHQRNHPRRIECVKVIEAPKGKIVHLKFHYYFNTEEDINCKHNFLEVRDGRHRHSPEIGKYCGRTPPQDVTSSHQYLWLRFLSDRNDENTTFQVDYTFLDKPDGNFSQQSIIPAKIIKRQMPDYPEELEDPNDPCWKFTVGYPAEMEFYSPKYPETYPSRSDCLKVIEAPEGKIIRLDFRDQFFMETDSECKYDSLEVRDGLHGYSYQIGKYCGSNFPDMITSSDRYLWLRFVSDDSIEYTGFKAVYTFIDKPGDQNTHKLEPCLFMKNGSEGWVNKTDISNETMMLHQTYNEKLDCMFIISVKEGWYLHLQFLHYKMDKPNECDSNYIEVFPNVTLIPARVNQFCGSIAKTTIVESNVSHIRFVAEPKAFNSSFAILWTAFRQIKKDEQCASDEFDCEDLTCIPIELKCNEVDNCRYRGDEDTEEVCIAHTSVLGKLFAETHMIAIVALFFIILLGMCSTFIYNCSRKLVRDHRTIKQQMAASRASRLDQVGKSCSVVQLSNVLPMSHSTDSSMSQHAECYVPETELMPILRSSGNTEELMLNDEMHMPEMRDSECQTRESLFHMPSFTPNSSGGDSFTPPPPPPPPSTRPPRSTPRSTTSPGFTTFGKSRQKTSAEPRFRAEAVIELNKRGDSNKTNERPFSVQSTKSAPDVIVTH